MRGRWGRLFLGLQRGLEYWLEVAVACNVGPRVVVCGGLGMSGGQWRVGYSWLVAESFKGRRYLAAPFVEGQRWEEDAALP